MNDCHSRTLAGAGRFILLMTSALFASALASTSASAQASNMAVVRIQQVSTGLYVDAYDYDGEDYRIVMREYQENRTQQWRLVHLGGGNFTIQQLSTERYWDAYDYEGADYRLVTRAAQNNNTQRWRLTTQGDNIYSIVQVSTGRFVDAHESADWDFQLVTRPFQDNNSQRWMIEAVDLTVRGQTCLFGYCF